MRNCLVWLCTLCCGMTISCSAMAGDRGRETVQVGFSDPMLRVFDLTPADGLPPGYTMSDGTTEMSASIYPPDWQQPTQTLQHTELGDASHSLRLSAYGVDSTVFKGSGIGTISVGYGRAGSAINAGLYLGVTQHVPLVLAPGSLLVVDGLAAGLFSDFAATQAELNMGVELSGLSMTSLRVCCEAREFNEPYQLAYANTGEQDLPLMLKFDMSMFIIHAIPEPASYLMILAGLAVLWGATRCRGKAGPARRGARHSIALSLLSCAALGGAAQASPETLASAPEFLASLGNIKLQIVDLDPADGIAAGYRLTDEKVDITNAVHSYQPPGANPREELHPQPGQAARSEINYLAFHTAIATDGTVGNVQAKLEWDPDTPLQEPFYHAIWNQYVYTAHVTLTPASAFILGGTLLQKYLPGGMHKSDLVQSFFTASLSGVNSPATYQESKIHYGDRYPEAWDDVSDFTVAVTNPHTEDIVIDLRLDLYSALNASVPLLPVPEPPAYTMIVAGGVMLLAGSLLSAQRRRSGCS